MNPRLRLVAACVVAAAAGCSTPGYRRSESAAAAARATKAAAEGFSKQAQECLLSMSVLFGEPYQDLATRFERFDGSVDSLSKANTRLANTSSSLERAADARFRAWDAENATFTNRELRTHAEERRDQVFKAWQQAQAPMAAGVVQAGAVTGEFADLRKLLSNDLTPAGVAAASGFAEKVRGEAGKAVDAAKKWADGLDVAIEAMSTGPTSAPAAAPVK